MWADPPPVLGRRRSGRSAVQGHGDRCRHRRRGRWRNVADGGLPAAVIPHMLGSLRVADFLTFCRPIRASDDVRSRRRWSFGKMRLETAGEKAVEHPV